MAGKTGCSLNWGGFDTAIAKAGHKMANNAALLESVGEALVSGTIRRFADEEGPDGEKWKPSGRALAQGGKTLTDSGALEHSIDKKVFPETGMVAVGSNKKYARIHQLGGTIRPKAKKHLKFKGANGWATVDEVDMPARPFIGVSKADMDEVRATIALFLQNSFTGK